MRQKIKNFMNKPITWGASCKASAIVLAIYAVVVGMFVAIDAVWSKKKSKNILVDEKDEFEKEFDKE